MGSGTAVLQGWQVRPRPPELALQASDPETFRPQLRDLYVPAGNVGFWQAAIRDASDPDHGLAQAAYRGPHPLHMLRNLLEAGCLAVSRIFLLTGRRPTTGS